MGFSEIENGFDRGDRVPALDHNSRRALQRFRKRFHACIFQRDAGQAVFDDFVGALYRAQLLPEFVDLRCLQPFESGDDKAGAFFSLFG